MEAHEDDKEQETARIVETTYRRVMACIKNGEGHEFGCLGAKSTINKFVNTMEKLIDDKFKSQ